MGCGVTTHDDDCLCDVVVKHPAPYVGCAIQDMWMGQEIVNLMGFTPEWDDESIIKYLEALVYAKDNWDQNLLEFSGAGISELRSFRSTRQQALRSEIRRRLQTSKDRSIMRVADELGLDFDALVYALFGGRRQMTKDTLLEFEQDVLQRNFTNPYSLGKKYDMRPKSANRLHSCWGVPYGEHSTLKPKREILDRVDELIVANTLTNREIVDTIIQEFGYELKMDKVRHRRRWLRLKDVNA